MKITTENEMTLKNELDVIPEFIGCSWKEEVFNTMDVKHTEVSLHRVSPRIKNYHMVYGRPVKVTLVDTMDFKDTNWWVCESGVDLFKYCKSDSSTTEDMFALMIPQCTLLREYKDRYRQSFPFLTREADKPTPILIKGMYRYLDTDVSTHIKPSPVNLVCVSGLESSGRFNKRTIANYLRTYITAFKQARKLGAETIGTEVKENPEFMALIQYLSARATKVNLRYCGDRESMRKAHKLAKKLLPDDDKIEFSKLVDKIYDLHYGSE